MEKVLEATQVPLTAERHIWACANTILKQYGDAAWFHASTRADELLEAGDLDGHAMWKSILARIVELEQMSPSGAVQ